MWDVGCDLLTAAQCTAKKKKIERRKITLTEQ